MSCNQMRRITFFSTLDSESTHRAFHPSTRHKGNLTSSSSFRLGLHNTHYAATKYHQITTFATFYVCEHSSSFKFPLSTPHISPSPIPQVFNSPPPHSTRFPTSTDPFPAFLCWDSEFMIRHINSSLYPRSSTLDTLTKSVSSITLKSSQPLTLIFHHLHIICLNSDECTWKHRRTSASLLFISSSIF